MSARSPDDTGLVLQAFLKGLGEAGFFDGQNVTIEYRWARGDYSRLPAFAAELVSCEFGSTGWKRYWFHKF